MHLIFASVYNWPNDKIGQMTLLPAGKALYFKKSKNVKYNLVFLKELPLPVLHSHLKHLLTVCGML